VHPLCLRHHTCESTGLWTAVRDAVTGATTSAASGEQPERATPVPTESG